MASRNHFSSAHAAWREWILPVAGGISLVGGALLLLSFVAEHGDLSAAFEKPARPAATSYGQPILQEDAPAESDAPAPGIVAVYSCERAGQRVFSDVPCGPGLERQEVDVGAMNSYAPPAIDRRPVVVHPSPRPEEPYAVRAPESSGESQACLALENAIEHLNARMRAGYSSAEGERLRRRWHELKDEHHRAGCTWHER